MPDSDKIILEIPRAKDNGEVLRATESVFRDTLMFGIRVWFHDEKTGEMRPGKNGLNLPRSEWPEFKRAVDALEKAMTLTNEKPETANA